MILAVMSESLLTFENSRPTNDTIMLTNNDVVMPRCFISKAYFYKNDGVHSSFMDEDVLKNALKAVVENSFPDIAGQLVDTDDGGLMLIRNFKTPVKIILANSDVTLRSLAESGYAQQNLPDAVCDGVPGLIRSFADPNMIVRIVRLADNSGVVLVVSVSHVICDGTGFDSLMDSWSLACRGLSYTQPDLSRDCFKSTGPMPVFDHPEYSYLDFNPYRARPEVASPPSTPITRGHVFTFSAEKLGLLKGTNDTSAVLSTNDYLCALVWRCVTRARGLSDGRVRFGMAVNGRRRFDPPVSPDYFGNVNFYVHLDKDVQELLQASLTDIAVWIRLVLAGMSDERMRSALRWVGEKRRKDHIIASFALSDRDFAVTNWNSIPGEGYPDFSFGVPQKVRVPTKNFNGLAIVLPKNDEKSAEVVIGLLAVHMQRFVEDPELLPYLVHGQTLVL